MYCTPCTYIICTRYIYINHLVPPKYVQLVLQNNIAKYQKSFIKSSFFLALFFLALS